MHEKFGYSLLPDNTTKILKQIDYDLLNMISEYDILEWFIPALIDGAVLRRCGYFSTLQNHLTKVGFIKRDRLQDLSSNKGIVGCDYVDNSPDVYLTPAACLHFYPTLEQNPLENKIITTLARVYRYEDGNFTAMERQWDFTVREFVAVGSVDYVKGFLNDLENKIYRYAKKYFCDVSIEEANDHFYPTRSNKLKERFQLKNNLKNELIASNGNNKIAISSTNYHESHFSKEFHFDNNGKIVTGCIGCGLERWLRGI